VEPYPNRNRDRNRNQNGMGSGHEKLDTGRLCIGYVAWVYEKAAPFIGQYEINGFAPAGQYRLISIPIPIAISIRMEINFMISPHFLSLKNDSIPSFLISDF
jgi:hypothetical protein